MTFKSARSGFVIAVIVVGLLHLFFEINLQWLILPSGIYLALIIYGSAIIQSNFHTQAYCYGNVSEKEIALSFDDGPNRQYTPQVLSTLAQYNASATFFVIGKNIRGNEGILKQIDADGHSIGNHSYTHSFYIDFKSQQGFKDELNRTAESVFNIIGKRMKLFRPPYGVTTPNLVKASKLLNYNIIGWSIRSFDTTSDNIQTISKRVQTQIKPGAIILFHDTSDSTVQALKQTLNFTKENGYKIVSVERLLKIEAYE
ncbi:polysaccharide deacetylase family protein [Candidatus Methylobacter oryzae]|uniref:Polysaccharide deacetylase family protein n=1 Tax=Candidatus Methylobacter oryzae TaxID=2497749 RepID=A0ABY3C712_9GAMM|nr:polysaccharide deacetylase family protein [Candidatus Methylobacter oryzae]TRW90377.1 polysaccharide deacetylase family protein [Candidatus Methylobacter oryzae]